MTVRTPAPSQRSQRPPGTLNEKCRAERPTAARLRRGGEGLADRGKRIGIGRGVRARDAPDVLLVDGDDLVEDIAALDSVVLAGEPRSRHTGAARRARSRMSKTSEDLPGPGDTRHRDQQAQREAHGHVLEVMLARAVDGDGVVAWRAAPRGMGMDARPAR